MTINRNNIDNIYNLYFSWGQFIVWWSHWPPFSAPAWFQSARLQTGRARDSVISDPKCPNIVTLRWHPVTRFPWQWHIGQPPPSHLIRSQLTPLGLPRSEPQTRPLVYAPTLTRPRLGWSGPGEDIVNIRFTLFTRFIKGILENLCVNFIRPSDVAYMCSSYDVLSSAYPCCSLLATVPSWNEEELRFVVWSEPPPPPDLEIKIHCGPMWPGPRPGSVDIYWDPLSCSITQQLTLSASSG